MRPVDRIRALYRIVAPDVLTHVIDIGANPFAGKPPYGVFRRSDCCQVIGFEPLPEALSALQMQARHNDTFLPYAVGDGTTRTLYVTRNSGLVSTLEPDPSICDLLGPWWQRATQVKEKVQVTTHRLDDIEDVPRVDFLKIDIQGGELTVFENAQTKLENCVAIQTEVCFHSYYCNQPSFGAINDALSGQGFIAHKFVEMSRHPIAHDITVAADLKGSQITVADMIFVKDPTRMDSLSTEQVRHLAMVSFAVFRSFDLCVRCLSVLQKRGALAKLDDALALIEEAV